MTSYTFETMTAADAANFTASDTLVFSSPSNSALSVAIAVANSFDEVTLTGAGGVAHSFGANQLSAASEAGHISFADGSGAKLVLGTAGADMLAFDGAVAASTKGIYQGLVGNDQIVTNDGHAYAFGGAGSDTIHGGAGNDHLFGYAPSGDTTIDGPDSISGGGGSDYIQGNAGNDTLSGGEGSDRIQGGAGDDHISGDAGNDVINGNKGNDVIAAGAGDDFARGGKDDDQLSGDAGNDTLMGDLGRDTLTGGAGLDVLTGGEDDDVFRFGTGDAHFVTTGVLAYRGDEITDFTLGADKIDLGGVIGDATTDVLHAASGTSFGSVSAALAQAQQLITNAEAAHAGAGLTAVAALQVGTDTYLFYDDNGGDSVVSAIIKLDHVSAVDVTSAIFS